MNLSDSSPLLDKFEVLIPVASDDKQKRGLSVAMIVSLMTSAPFYVLLISNVNLQWAFDAFMTTLVDFAMDKGKTVLVLAGLTRHHDLSNQTTRRTQNSELPS